MAEQIKILVVDDDEHITKLLCRYFELEGYAIEGTNDSTRALDILKQGGHRIVITDLDMPEINGLELTRRIKNYDGSVRVIVITGRETYSNLTTAFQLGVEHIALKPLDNIDDLRQSVDRCIERIQSLRKVIQRVRDREQEQDPA